MAPGPGGSPFRARWDATSVSLYSVVNEPGGLFFPHPVFHTFFGFDSPSVGTFFQGKSSHPIFHTFFAFGRKKYQTFLQKNGRHSLSFDNRIKKYLSRNLFSDKEKAEKENRIGRFPSAHSGSDSRRNGETGILFVVLFLFFYIFFLLYSSHWGFMMNPPMVHLIQTLPPWLQRY